MTTEQREAVEFLEFYKQHCLKIEIENMDNYETIHDGDFVSKNLDTVLSLIKEQQEEMEKKDKIIEEIQEELRDHIGFENRLKRENKEPDLFNQGRFYVANNINNILKGKLKNVKDKR